MPAARPEIRPLFDMAARRWFSQPAGRRRTEMPRRRAQSRSALYLGICVLLPWLLLLAAWSMA